jgi:hypothetical protein
MCFSQDSETRHCPYPVCEESFEIWAKSYIMLSMGNGGVKLSKPNFQAMNLNELRRYVLAHRDDRATWDEFAARPRPNPIMVSADTPIEEQERIIKDLVDRSK